MKFQLIRLKKWRINRAPSTHARMNRLIFALILRFQMWIPISASNKRASNKCMKINIFSPVPVVFCSCRKGLQDFIFCYLASVSWKRKVFGVKALLDPERCELLINCLSLNSLYKIVNSSKVFDFCSDESINSFSTWAALHSHLGLRHLPTISKGIIRPGIV